MQGEHGQRGGENSRWLHHGVPLSSPYVSGGLLALASLMNSGTVVAEYARDIGRLCAAIAN
jgi:hypothetical protein